MIRCRVCERRIRGNAAREDYNPTTQENTYLCRKCESLTHGATETAERWSLDDGWAGYKDKEEA
jgi:hypothetical protein